MVASTTGTAPQAKFTGQFKCDAQCPMYATYKMCSHTIAVAEVTDKLAEFVKWMAKQKCGAQVRIHVSERRVLLLSQKTIDCLSGYSDSEVNSTTPAT